ncbi:MAG: Hpt domain-containing protein, partial [Methylobacter sp.]
QVRLEAFLQVGDVDSALRLLHAMKGVAANLAMPELRSRIEALEQALKKQSGYEPELLTGFASAQNRVLESVGQLRRSNEQEAAALSGN